MVDMEIDSHNTADDQKPNSSEFRSTAKIIPKGKPKSGRVWKSERKRFSSINKTKGIKSTFEQRQKIKQHLQQAKDVSDAIKEEFKRKEEERKQRRRENLKKQEENKRKAEVVQPITNLKKLKRMKKKQLRYIEKRDTTVVDTNKK